MKETIFRKKSMERISSPEKTDDYIKGLKPSIWLLVGAGILVAAAAVIWFVICQ
jgi:hypothetical protein